MKRLSIALTVTALFYPATSQASDRGWDRASSIARDALVAAAIGGPAVQRDWHGDVETVESMAIAGGTTFALKELVHERRPDGSDNNSFPSGHTSISFAAAASLEKRFGWHTGLPAFLVASFVGVGRVEADKHFVHDVLAGAAIGTLSGALLTSRHDDGVQLTPWTAHHGGGVSLSTRF